MTFETGAPLMCLRAMLFPEHDRARLAQWVGWGGGHKKKKKTKILTHAKPCAMHSIRMISEDR